MTSHPSLPGLADHINLHCSCQTLSQDALVSQLDSEGRLKGFTAQLLQSHPHLLSKTSVFLDVRQKQAIEQAITALEAAIALPAYRERVLATAPAVAQQDHGPLGVWMGYDFHLTEAGPQLIEINTNAGGGFLNAALAQAHRACCATMSDLTHYDAGPFALIVDRLMAMYRGEWQRQRGDRPWQTLAIVDDRPHEQYLAPEFELARVLLEQQGLEVVIADPTQLTHVDGVLRCELLASGRPVDMVYNRLTDFDWSDPSHQALRQAYEQGHVVVTPHPRAYALYAQKGNLVILSDDDQMAKMGLPPLYRETLQRCVPQTQRVTADNATALWASRRDLFFKPEVGYGSKAVYRGDKLTQRVWAEIVQGGYIAQQRVAPSQRLVKVDGEARLLKVDVRAYTYEGRVLLLAARTYDGQTTNMRTPGGGFSPVVVVSPASHIAC